MNWKGDQENGQAIKEERDREHLRREEREEKYERLAWEIIRKRGEGNGSDGNCETILLDMSHVEEILERLRTGRFDETFRGDIHERAVALSLSPGFDRLLGLSAVRDIVPFDYQIKTVQDVLTRMRGRAILADEVGLGKTIEAGLIMMEYILRGLVKRVLILCPSALVSQWADEMRFKFNLNFAVFDDGSFIERVNPWEYHDRIIASIDTAKRDPHKTLISATEFDLVIVDEAHRCRNRNTLNWKLVNSLKKKYILLLTATPVQNDLTELFNLVTLLRPGQLETARKFSEKFITRGDRLKPKNPVKLRRLVREVMVRNRRETCGAKLPRRRADTIKIDLSEEERLFFECVTEFVRKHYPNHSRTGWYQNGSACGSGGPHIDVRRKLPDNRAQERLVLKTIQKEAGSTVFAATVTLEKIARNGGGPFDKAEVSRLLDVGRAVKTCAKADALYSFLRSARDKVVVFTSYIATLDYVAAFLEERGIRVARFSGGMTRAEKDRAIEAFRGDVPVLLCTDSGGEGRNLQFCHVMINFDLPWNPMRIEQRIGRIHRIGQTNDVTVVNFSAQGTLEAGILELLDAKINMFELVVGELDMILGNIGDEVDFEDLIMDIWAGSKDANEMAENFQKLGEKLEKAKGEYLKTRAYDDEIFGIDPRVDKW